MTMTKEAFYDRLKEIRNEAYEKKVQAIKDYCNENNPYRIGDKFTDHIGTIIIEKIDYGLSESDPCCIYYGVELRKNGSFFKDNRKRYAYQSNEIKA